ncbi:hypothetical protein [Tahibacter soli]|uniref:Uncharacterized protein n=1 Tax=Tahibacter soli TaxID=2983605 RepID=A0A9X3YS28_9GAMM|nr:hypothetical protein [Tahibacter soli]MDC8015316.1 hypothetical protein [Tahibacter soli]
MSYVLQIWELPQGSGWPTTVREASALVMGLHGPTPGQNPKFLEFARRLTARYPCITTPDEDLPEGAELVWTDGPLDGITDEAVYGIGIDTDTLVDVRPFVITTALSLGLNVEDDQAGEYFLANGGVLSVDIEIRRRDAAAAAAAGQPAAPALPSREELSERIVADIGPLLERHGLARAPQDDAIGGIYVARGYEKSTPAGRHKISLNAISDGKKTCRITLDWTCWHYATSALRKHIKFDGVVPADAPDFGAGVVRLHRWIDDRDGVLTPDGPDGKDRVYAVPHRDDIGRCTSHLARQIEKRLLPMIAQFETVEDFDRLANPDPVTDSPFFDRYYDGGAIHIAAAYLAGNPRLAALCDEFWNNTQQEAMFMEGQRLHLRKCIAWVRANPKR